MLPAPDMAGVMVLVRPVVVGAMALSMPIVAEVMVPAIPLTKAQPIMARIKARPLILVNFSLKNSADSSVTNIGDVYIRIAATAAELTSTFLK